MRIYVLLRFPVILKLKTNISLLVILLLKSKNSNEGFEYVEKMFGIEHEKT